MKKRNSDLVSAIKLKSPLTTMDNFKWRFCRTNGIVADTKTIIDFSSAKNPTE